MNATKIAILFALSLPLSAIGCASEDIGEDAPTTEDELARAAPSKALATALLGAPQSGRNEEVSFISVGHLEGSSQTCLASALVWSKAPPNTRWNDVSITVPGSIFNGATVPFFNGRETSTERDALETRGKTLRYSRRGPRQNIEMRAELEFATSPKGAESLRRVALNVHGTTTVCEDLKSLVVLRDSVSQPIVMKAKDEYSRARRENMDGLTYQGCDLLNATTVLCEVGDAAGDRGATFVFSPQRGKLGNVRSVEVWRR